MEKSNKVAKIVGKLHSLWVVATEKSLADSFKEFSLALLLISPVFILLFYIFLPVAPSDWSRMFYVVPKIPLDPYQIPTFNYPPWLTVILMPFSIFSLKFSQALNAFASLFFVSLLVLRFKGNWLSLLITLTSLPFINMLGNVNVDWIVAAAFVFPSIWTLPLVLVKPQVGIFVTLLWIKHSKNKILFLIAGIFFLAATLFIWEEWPLQMWQNIRGLSLGSINSSFFPWSIPFGLLLLYVAWIKDDELAAVGATLCIAPYFAPQSLIVGFAILSARYWKIALAMWVFLWGQYYFW